MADLGIHIEAVARELLGEPNPHQSTATELRFGTKGSLSVEIAGERRGTWYDHEKKIGGGVLDLVREKKGLTNGTAMDYLRGIGIEVGAKPEASPKAKAPRRVVATYDYADEAGDLLFQVLRYEPKGFSQRRPDGRGGWAWNLDGTRRVPYRLRDLAAAVGREVILVPEGEKDVDNLRRLGFAATCNPGGAGKWPADFARYFHGADVVVLPDHHDTGRAHADQVAANLRPVAARVRVLEMPEGTPHKGDVSWWIHERGMTADRLRELVVAAPDWVEPVEPLSNPAEPADLGAFLSAANWLGRTIKPPEPLLGEVVTNTTRMFLGGPTGLGKTHVGFGMAAGMATGEGFLHWTASRPSRVLYLDGEMSRDLVQERLADLRRRFGGAELSNLFVLCAEDREEIAAMCPELGELGPLNSPQGQAFVLGLIDRLGGVDVVFLDNRMSLLSGDMKEEQPWTDTMSLVKELTRRRIAQVWIDHTGHDTGRIYGTKTKEWQFDVVALMEKAERPGSDIAFSLRFDKARRRKPSNRADFEPFTATLADDEWAVEGAACAKVRRKVSNMTEAFHKALLDALVKAARPGVTTRDHWYAECTRLGLVDPLDPEDTRAARDRKKSRLRKHMGELKAAGWIGVNGDEVRSLTVEPVEPCRTLSNHHPSSPVTGPVEPRRGMPDHGPSSSVEPCRTLSNQEVSSPAEAAGPGGSGVEPVEPRKRGVEPLSNQGPSNLSNRVEPLSNPCRTTVEPSAGTGVEPVEPVSIDGVRRFDSSTAPEEASE